MIPDILQKIVETKVEELRLSKLNMPFASLEELAAKQGNPLNMSGALLGQEVRIITEIKKASPSKGLLRRNFDHIQLADTYASNGTAAISVLTDAHFQGNLAHMLAVKHHVASLGIPILRKDFIFDPYQIYESRAYGADAVLLIVALLSSDLLKELLLECKRLWMQSIVEIHTEQELEIALNSSADIIGINNRDLKTFHTDLSVTRNLTPKVPRGKVVVSESGIKNRNDILHLRKMGVHAALVGEALVTCEDVGAKLRELTGK